MKKAILYLFIIFISASIQATEGMWIPLLLKSLNESDMHAMGLRLSAEDIYSINKSSLKDAVVHFGGGCTAEVVSDQGLILTNHHCGYGQIQMHSTEENNYLKNGFWAMTNSQELKNKNLTATFIVRIEDVTQRILEGITPDMSAEQIAKLKASNKNNIISSATKDTHFEAQIKPFFYGNEYYMIITETYKDVRLVGAPPSSIGKFGGDTDNWVWPRHTGDFSVFRIYADKDNNPADISDDNVPYTPKHVFPVAVHDMEEGEFCMVYGFPGRTYQYLTSNALDYVLNTSNPTRIQMRETSLSIINATMKSSEKNYIKYAAKQSRISNSYKKWIGQNIGLKENSALQKKIDFERDFQMKAKSKSEYATLLSDFKSLYSEIHDYEFARDMFIELYYMGPEIFRFSYGFQDFEDFETLSSKSDFSDFKKNKFEGVKGYFKNYDVATDKQIFSALVKLYRELMKDELEPASLQLIDTKFNGDVDAFSDYVYEKSVFCDESKTNNFLRAYNKGIAKKMLKDPAYVLAKDIVSSFRASVIPRYNVLSREIDVKMKTYLKARMELFPEKKYAADANSTLRLTYGKIEGSSPRDGMNYTYYTTLDGMIQKNNLGNDDYELSPRVKELWEKKDYGIYAQNGELRVCFSGSNHTTGGNSGSPVLNGDGELIGINFDRSWESTMSDYLFDTNRCRNIAVDIRYVLWVIDKYAGAGHLVKEMKLSKKRKESETSINYELLIKQITEQIVSSPSVSAALYAERGQAFASINKIKEGIQDYQEALNLQPENSDYLIGFGDLLIADKQFTKALKYAEKILSKKGKNIYALTLSGKALVGLGDKKSAMIRFNKAINGVYGEPYYQRGLLNLELGRQSDACRDFGLAAKAGGGLYYENYKNRCQ
ncbi:MAG: serine protease [Crocinitomicaceae bacterium]|nr:serine protease [Crocinitomicaceae bacterium]